ncbi:MAG: thioredoxin [Bacteroidetes bacterium]|nr:thioredoxin [Bacteroidota bacterium]
MPSAIPATLVDVEAHLRERIATDGVHVVHLWAPWCDNSLRDLESGGWARLREQFPEASFAFVTVWNDDEEPGRTVLDGHGLADLPEHVAQGSGTHADKASRVRTFLDHRLAWIPSTWIFNRNGERAFALDYGEMHEGTLASLLNAAYGRW